MDNKDSEPVQPWSPSERMIRVGELDPETGHVPVRISNDDPRPGGLLFRDLPENWRQEKNPQEYAADCGARMAEMPDSDGKYPSWRSGWNDADTELLEQARHARCLEEAGKTTSPGRVACCSMRAAWPARTA